MKQKKRPVHIVTGFLGSGKTTLLNQLLQSPSSANIAVIINEYGEVGLDHQLVVKSDNTVVELSNGCLCCTVRGELVDTILDLQDRTFDQLVIETTGLADPGPVIQVISGHPEISKSFEIANILAVIDGQHGRLTIENHVEAQQQIALATKLLVSKLDLLEEDDRVSQFDLLVQTIADLNPIADVVPFSADFDFDQLMGGTVDYSEGARRSVSVASNVSSHHHHSSHIQTLILRCSEPLPEAAVERFLAQITSVYGNSILRVKGLAFVQEHEDQPMVVHAVKSVFYEPSKLSEWPKNEKGTMLVVIMQNLDPEIVQNLFMGFLNQPNIDQADRAALMENPLAVSGHKF